MPDCDWCNERNCPATEDNVSKKKMWFFAKSRDELTREIEKINEKCARVCGECAKEVQNKLDKSGTVKSKSWLGENKTYHRELSESEKKGLRNLKVNYERLDLKARHEIEEQALEKKKKNIKRLLVRLKEDKLQTFKETKSLIDDPVTGKKISDDLDVKIIKVGEEMDNITNAVMVIDAYLNDLNFIEFMVCITTAEEPRLGIDRRINGYDRIEAAVKSGLIFDKSDGYYEMNPKKFDQVDWYKKAWEEYITAYDPESAPLEFDRIDPAKCMAFPESFSL